MALLASAQQAERAHASATVGAAIDSMLASAVAAVSASFAARRALLANASPVEREAVHKRLAGEQAAEIARLVHQFTTERRTLRRQALSLLVATHRTARRSLSTQLRRERAVFAILMQSRKLVHRDARVQPKTRRDGGATRKNHLRRQRP